MAGDQFGTLCFEATEVLGRRRACPRQRLRCPVRVGFDVEPSVEEEKEEVELINGAALPRRCRLRAAAQVEQQLAGALQQLANDV